MTPPAAPRITTPTGAWLIAGTPTGEQYPCRCDWDGPCRRYRCTCHGRTDVDGLPAHCCGRRAVETARRNSTEE